MNSFQKLNGLRILVAGDEYDCLLVTDILHEAIGEVLIHEASNEDMVFEMLKKSTYDILLINSLTPILNGIDTALKIRNDLNSPSRDIIIFVLTTSVDNDLLDRLLSARINGYIQKPFTRAELIRTIYEALFGNIAIINEEKKYTISNVVTSPSVIDMNCLNEYAEDDFIRRQHFIDLFLHKIPLKIEQLKEALKLNDTETMRIISHSIKPQLQSMGVQKGLELAALIEKHCCNGSKREGVSELVLQLEKICHQAVNELSVLNSNE